MDDPPPGASDYRNPIQTQTTAQKTYSSVVSKQQFPTKEQAILFPALEGIPLQDYIFALGAKIGPKNIVFSSRISNNRICIYLSSKEQVDKTIAEHGSISINGQTMHARRLVTPAQRLVMSNVCPTIPHNILEDELKILGLILVSPITFLKIGVSNPEYNHIFSFRRQVFIAPPNIEIPSSILTNYDNTDYRIFLSQDGISCFKCKQPGHIVSQCPNTENDTENTELNLDNAGTPDDVLQEPNQTTEANTLLRSTTNKVNPLSSQENTPEKANTSKYPDSGGKRSIEEILTPPIDPNATPQNNMAVFAKPELRHIKKSKQNIAKPKTGALEPAKRFIETHEPSFILNFEQITDLMENIHGSPNAVDIAQNYTTNLPALNRMLQEVYPHLTERNMKTRITKFRKKIRSFLDGTTPEIESDSSLDSTY